jgi:hypothetical protein
MTFKNTKPVKDDAFSVAAHVIASNSDEYIISVFADERPIYADIIVGVQPALDRTRALAAEYNCKYKFANFPNK